MREKKETMGDRELAAMMMAQESGRGTGPSTSGMVRIEGGTISGSNPMAEGESHSDDYPATYDITVDDFLMDKYLVTIVLWDEVYHWALENGYSFDNAGRSKAAGHPVQRVNWYDVVKWCNARSEKEGRTPVYKVNGAVYRMGRSDNVVQSSVAGYRLPTDAEWEYAARGGLQSKRFPWGETIQHARANYFSSSDYPYDTSPRRGSRLTYDDGVFPYTSPVGSFAPNGYGLYDMIGNVWEWCFTASGSGRVLRGGGWPYSAYYCRVASRYGYSPDCAYIYVGFRSVLPPDQ